MKLLISGSSPGVLKSALRRELQSSGEAAVSQEAMEDAVAAEAGWLEDVRTWGVSIVQDPVTNAWIIRGKF